MKKFIFKLLLFLVVYAVVDYVLGLGLGWLAANAKGGDTARNYHITHSAEEDVLIFGSSRASNHYNSRELEKQLGSSVYNCGENETGIMYFYPLLNLIKKHHLPKVIIYDVYTMDLLDNLRLGHLDYLKPLKTSYGIDCVDSMFFRSEPTSKIKMLSSLYRNNSTFLNVLFDWVRNNIIYDKGFYLLNTGKLIDKQVPNDNKRDFVYDSEKLSFLEKFIKENKDSINIIFSISPEYGRTTDDMFDPLKKLCDQYNIPLLNHYCDTTFTMHSDYFGNVNHLNRDGAVLYTRKISEEIKGLW